MNRHMLLWLTLVVLSPGTAYSDLIYSTAGSVLSQNFNSLANNGTVTWTNDSTLAGWYSNAATYTADNGNSSSLVLYSYGSVASNERALGINASGTTIAFGVAILNNTGLTLDAVNIAYDGEQWRQGNANSAISKTLSVDYRVTSVLGTLNDAGFTAVPGLNFTSPVNGLNSGTQLDGNSPANRTQLSQSLNGVNWQNGDYLWVRWTSQASTPFNVGHGLAVDNFSLSATAVPEPSSILLLSAAASVVAIRSSRRQPQA